MIMMSSMTSLYPTHLENKITLLSTSISNSVTSMEYALRKLIYLSSREPMTFHIGTLSSRYRLVTEKAHHSAQVASIKLIYIDKS